MFPVRGNQVGCSMRSLFIVAMSLYGFGVQAVNFDSYDLGTKYKCGPDAGEGKTSIFWPDGDGPFGVVFFAHGASGYDVNMEGWLRDVSATGFVVVAPNTDVDADPSKNSACLTDSDLTLAFTESKAKKGSLHPALRDGFADWSRTGVFGHSMGAKHLCTMYNSAPSDFNIKALVMSHDSDVEQCKKLDVPSMYTVSEGDTQKRQTLQRDSFNDASDNKITHKVFANLLNGGHMEPETTGKSQYEGQLNMMTAYFLSAHVNQNSDHHDLIYGSGDGTLCHGSIAFAEGNCVTQPSDSQAADAPIFFP